MPDILVLVTGVFDILHQEHIAFLQKAKAQGTKLIVGVESDVRVRAMKGDGRPVNSQLVRVANLEKLGIANEVFVLPEQFSKTEEHLALLQKIKPAVLAVSENTPHLESKRKLMAEIGGRVVVVHPHNPNISTTILLAQQKAEQGS